MSVVDLLRETRARPEAIALVGKDRSWTYRQLEGAVDERADRLREQGRRTGDVAPVTLDADPDGVIYLLALWRLGATPAPLHTKLTAPERKAARATLARVRADAQAILWTSGTTGRPRGVAISYAALRASAMGAADRLELGERDVWLASLSPAHIGGLALVTRSLLLGGTLVAVAPVDPTTLLDLIRDRGVTHVSLVPTQLLRLLDAAGEQRPPRPLRCVLVGGAATPRDLLARALAGGWPVALTYGLSEATSQVATAPPALARRKPGTVGPPLAGVDVRIDRDGEIHVRGTTLASGYVGEGASALVDEEGWHHTSDVGRFDEDGDLWVTGRRADRIVSGGVTVDALEVEEVLRSHPGVRDACVVGVADAEWGERVAAWVEPAGEAPDPSGLDAYLRARLGGPKLPRRYHVARDLPRNANGKVDRVAVRDVLSRPG